MSLLPQRKKSPEELAKLRESLGVPGFPASQQEPPPEPATDTVVATHHTAIVEHHPASPSAPPEPAAPQDLSPAPPPAAPKPVRSLRKSEQGEAPDARPSGLPESSKLPVHRHSDREIAELRRREALQMMNSAPPNPKFIPAHPALIAPGYVLALAGALCFFWETFPLAATAGCAAAAIAIAATIARLRPLSRHHAAFIAILALLVLVFSALHFFPQLRHAT